MPFSDWGLAPALLQVLAHQGLHTPTPIQAQAIPPILAGRDTLACAPTGSGKTLAFGLPLLHRLAAQQTAKRAGVRALVLVPTRELAVQVADTLRPLARALPQPLKISVVFGGVSINPQMMALRGTDLLVATPGRLLDLVRQHAVQLGHTQVLVLDEADRMLDLGFEAEWQAIQALLPTQRHTLFFSATFVPPVLQLAERLLHNPVQLEANLPQNAPAAITQRAIAVDPPRRTQLLRHLIQSEHWSRVLVFVATKHAAEMVADKLRRCRIHAEPFHGALSQGKRTQVLADFKALRLQVVVATDVAARGLDIAQLPVVVNYDLPRSATDYTHRIGRTGRAGDAGLALSLVSPGTEAHWRLIEKRHRIQVPRETVAGFEPTALSVPTTLPEQLAGTGGIKGKRPNKKDKLRALKPQ